MRWFSIALLVCACTRGAKSPEEGRALVAAGDPRVIYDLTDTPTRWSIDATFKYHQQALSAIEESYPSELQAREKARFVDGDDVRGFLAAYDARYRVIASGDKNAFVQESGRWRWSGMRTQWDDIKLRASHDLDTVRESAAAYKRAAR